MNVSTREDESVRDYLRMYEQMKTDVKRAKQRLLQFLQRRRVQYGEGNNWTERHRRWLNALEFDNALDRRTLDEYYACVVTLEEKCQRLQVQVEQLGVEDRYAEAVRSLKVFKGVGTLIALTLIAEIGDFKRFASAEQLMAFLGLVPSGRSSGNKRRQGSITKAGNSHLRKLLIEASWHYRSYRPRSKRLAKRREEAPA